MRVAVLTTAWCLSAMAADTFIGSVKPILTEHCSECHNPANPKNKVGFLRAQTADDVAAQRGLWHKVAAHIRNRTMPPAASKITEQQRLEVSNWVDERLRATACAAGEQPGSVTVRRLSRREYRNTIRDLVGVDFPVEEIFPTDGSGGEGFDNNGETLFVPPLLMERYLEATQQILDRAIVTPALNKIVPASELFPGRVVNRDKPLVLQPGETMTANFSAYLDGEYDLRVSIDRPRDRERDVFVSVDGGQEVRLAFARDPAGGPTSRAHSTRLARGPHTMKVRIGAIPIDFFHLRVDHRQPEPSAEKRTVHYRLLRMEPGETPPNPRDAARRLLTRFVPRAFRRPAQTGEVDKFLALYDRAAQRGDAFEEAVKLALKGVLLSPQFLFRIEQEPPEGKTAQPLSDYELATRLSYFLWATTPDDELLALATAGKLQDPTTLTDQVDRMIDDPRSRAFANSFIGQWLGTKEVGGRLVPAVSAVQHFYTPEVAVDLREEPVLLFHHMLTANRPLTDLITANYTFLTARLVKFYELDGRVTGVGDNTFQRVEWPDNTRAGVLGMGSVLAMTSHFKQTSPVLRGAWILDTLLGTPAPPPPPDVPALEVAAKSERGLTTRQIVTKHRENPSCAACHNLMDPLGLALENFDFMGRWRDTDAGQKVDATGAMPTGEKFDGPAGLRQAILAKKDAFLQRVTGKVLGYALGRSLEDTDQCTIQRIVERIGKDNLGTRSLIREIALSIPFRQRGPALDKDLSLSSKPVSRRVTPRQAQ